MRAWPTKNAAKLVTSPTTKVTTAKTSDLAAQYPASLRDGDQAGADHPGRVLGADAEHPEHGDGHLGDGRPRQADPSRVPCSR